LIVWPWQGRLAAMNDAVITLDDPDIPVRLRVTARARRFTLRLEPTGDGAVLTLPPGVPMADARMFLMRQSDWLVRALERQPRRVVVGPGTRLPVAGVEVEIHTVDGPRRAPRLEGGRLILSCAGLRGFQVGPRVMAFLKTRARDALVPAARRYAGLLGRQATAVALRDTRSRWGSCSSAGRLSFSWRLAMAPPLLGGSPADHAGLPAPPRLAEKRRPQAAWVPVRGGVNMPPPIAKEVCRRSDQHVSNHKPLFFNYACFSIT
jgi:predicted metal-dependent hydrolase